MAWAERTIHEVVDPPTGVKDEEDRINSILKNMPPFIKLSSRRARKTLAKYEEVKQRHIENLRNNSVFKFVMMVAGFTNENMQKYWKGSDVSPFQEGYGPKDVKIDKEEIELLVQRARERAFADLHQFCRPIPAVPMFRKVIRRREPVLKKNGRDARVRVATDGDLNLGGVDLANSPQKPRRKPVRRNLFSAAGGAVADASTVSPTVSSDPGRPNPQFTEGENKRDPANLASGRAADIRSARKYIYNMSDMEFKDFCSLFLNEKFNKRRIDGDNKIDRYVLGDIDSNDKKQNKDNNFPADDFQRASNLQRESVRDLVPDGQTPNNEPIYAQYAEYMYENERIGQGVDRVFDEGRIYDRNGQQVDSFDHDDPYVSLPRENWKDWAETNPIIRWGDNRSVYSFQRYIARWLVDDHQDSVVERFDDLQTFQNQYRILFNNLFLKDVVWYRDLTGLRLTKMIRGAKFNNRGNPIHDGETSEGQHDNMFPCETPCEVPLDFVQPLFNERFAYWKHELVLGEYEKRTMYEADQWLQKTPWAIGKIYLQPNIYSHMQEAHIAISTRFKKFNSLSLQDWLTSEKHMFFYAKLVALCIRTSAVLSNKKYGLDKAYMRLNLEKRRIMYSLGKMEKPKRMPVARLFPRASANQERLWEDYRAARARGDVAGAQVILQRLN